MVVKRGDIVSVTIKMWEPPVGLLIDNRTLLQQRLRQAGFEVVAIDDSGLTVYSWGQLLVSVKPLTSDYGSEYDVASVVNGAAIAAGYVSSGDFNGQIVGYGPNSQTNAGTNNANGTWRPPSAHDYEQNLNRPNVPRNDEDDDDEDVNVGLIVGIGAAVVAVAALLLKK